MLNESLLVAARRDGIERFVVGAVVHDDRQVLLLTRSDSDDFLPGIEELPSGHVESGETLAAALDRELMEEIGSTGPVESGFLATFDYNSSSGRATRQFTVSVAWNQQDLRLSSEHTAYRWAFADLVNRSQVTTETRSVLRAWFEWRG